MSVELASLMIKVDATQADQAAKSLDKLADSGGKAEPAIGKTASAAEKLADSARKAMGAADGASGSFAQMGASLAIAGAAGGIAGAMFNKLIGYIGEMNDKVVDLVKESALLSARYETLGVVLHVAGNNAGYTAKQMDAFTEAVAKNGITGTQAREALVRMATAHLDVAKSAQLSREAQDLAVVGNINSSEAFGRLVDALQTGNVEMLRTLGLNVDFQGSYERLAKTLKTTPDALTENEKAGARLNLVLAQGKDFAGIYEQAMGTAGKQVSSMARYSEEAKQSLGDMLLPVTTTLVFDLKDAFEALNGRMAELARSDVARFLGGTLYVAFKVVEIGITGALYIAGQFIRALGAMASTAAALARGDFKAVGEIGKSFAKDYEAAAKSYSALLTRQLQGSAQARASGEAERMARAGVNRENQTHLERLDAISKATAALQPKEAAIGKIRAEQAVIQRAIDDHLITQAAGNAAIAAGEAKIAELRKKHGGEHAATLIREAAAMEATIAGNFRLAAAYAVSNAEGIKAEAITKATASAITKRADIAAAVDRQIRLAVSEQASAGAKSLAAMSAETAARKTLNDQVEVGTLSVSEANEQLRDDAQLRPLVVAAALAEGSRKADLLKIIQDLTGAQRASNDEAHRAAILAANAANDNQIELLQAELGLIGKTNVERAVALAQLRAMQALRSNGYDPGTATPEQKATADASVTKAGATAGLDARVRQEQDAYNDSLIITRDLLANIDDQTRSAASGMANAFGQVGKAIGDVTTILSGYALKQEEIAVARKAYTDAGGKDEQRLALFTKQAGDAQIRQYGDIASAAKGFFKQGSTGYKALEAAEKTYRLFELAMSVRSIFYKGAEAAAHVTGETVKATSSVASAGVIVGANIAVGTSAAAAGVATQALGDPYTAFARMAAMAAIMAGLGFAVLGGKGGSIPGANDAETRQKTQGTGTVLGDANAKSDSIAKSLALVAQNTNKDLEYSNSMLKALRSIDNAIGAVAAALAKTLAAGGALDTSKLNLGTTTAGPGLLTNILSPISLLLPGLFGSTTTKTLQDQGLTFGTQTVGDISKNGIDGSTYQQVGTETKKKFLGITYSDKTSSSTSTAAIEADLQTQLTLLVGSLRNGVLAAATALGVDGAGAVLDAFQVDLGKISLKGLTGDEIEKQLNAVFSKLGDQMASSVIPGLEKFQKVGEGTFETLTRLAKEYQVVDVSLRLIGKTFAGVGLSSIEARDRLVQLAGGLDELSQQTSDFADAYLTDIERIAPVQKAVGDELARLGVVGVTTKDQFKALVLGLDVSTQAGAELYTALLAVAPAFAKVADFASQGSQAVQSARSDLTKAYSAERDALTATISKFQAFSDSLKKFRDSLYTGPAAQLSPEEQYRAAKAAFADTSAKAAAGNESAIGDLQSVSQAYLDASKAYYASSAGYFADLDAVRSAVTATQGYAASQVSSAQAQLAALDEQVKGLLTVNDSVLSVRDAILALQKAQGGTTGAGAASFDASTYLKDNPDIVAAFASYAAGANVYGFSAGLDQAAFAKEHYDRTGQTEIAQGLRKFATGGSGVVGGSGGTDSKLVSLALTPGELVNVRTPSQANDNAVVAELRAVRAELVAVKAELRADKTQRAAISKEQADGLERIASETDRVRKAVSQ